MHAFLFTLLLSPALAAHWPVPDCGPQFVDQPAVSPPVARIWGKFSSHATSLNHFYSGVYSDTLPHAWERSQLARTGRALAVIPVTPDERASLCEHLVPLMANLNLVRHDADLAWHLLDQVCGLHVNDVMLITHNALAIVDDAGTYEYERLLLRQTVPFALAQEQVRTWLRNVVKAPGSAPGTKLINAVRWRQLLDRMPVKYALPLAEALAGDWSQLGITADVRLRLAERMITDDHSFRMMQIVTGLPDHALAPLVPQLSAQQWLEYRYARGELNENTLNEFAGRVDVEPPAQKRRAVESRARDFLERLIYDVNVPMPVVERTRDLLERLWARRYDRPMPSPVYRPADARNERQLERAERFFTRAVVRPHLMHRTARRFARGLGSLLYQRLNLDTIEDFVASFDLTKIYALPRPVAGGLYAPEDRARVRAVAEVYFKILREHLPRFLELNPSSARLWWILETPLQFEPFAVERDYDRRTAWERLTTLPDHAYDTGAHISAIVTEALTYGLARSRTTDEWIGYETVPLLKQLPFREYARAPIERHVAHAIRIGDGKLNWLDHAEPAANTLEQLAWLRDLVPRSLRSDDTLTARAISVILEDDARHLIESGPSFDVHRLPFDITLLRRALFEYLAARAAAGVILHVDADFAARLRAIALESGYTLTEITHDASNVAFTLTARTQGS